MNIRMKMMPTDSTDIRIAIVVLFVMSVCEIAIFADQYRGKLFENATKVNIPAALRSRSLESPEGERVTVEVYCESGYNVYFVDGKIVKVAKPEDLPAGCKFEYYAGHPFRKHHERGFYEIRRFIGKYVANLKQHDVFINNTPACDSCTYLGSCDDAAYWVRLFDGFYSDEELAAAKLDEGELPLERTVVEEGSEVVDGVKYHYQICSTNY